MSFGEWYALCTGVLATFGIMLVVVGAILQHDGAHGQDGNDR